MANPFDRFDVNPFDQFDTPLPETPIAPAEPTLGSSVLGGMVAPVLPETAPVPIMPRGRRVTVGLGDGVLQAPAMPVIEGVAANPFDRFDESTAAGDWRAGMLQAGQIIPGIKAAGGLIEARVGPSDVRMVTAEAQALSDIDSEIEVLKNQIAQFGQAGAPRIPSDQRNAIIADMRDLSLQRNQLAMLAGEGVAEQRIAESTREAESGVAAIAEALPEIISRTEQIQNIPMNLAAAAIGEAETFGEGFEAFKEDPLGAIRSFTLRSAPASLPTVGAAIGGSFIGGPAVAAALAGGTGASTEFGMSVAQDMETIMRDAGVEVGSTEAITDFIASNPEALEGVIGKAGTRSGIIGLTDAISGGFTGRIASHFAKSTVGKRLAAVIAGGGVEAAMEGVGEGLAGRVTEGEWNPGEIMAEVLGAGGQGFVTTGGQLIAEIARKSPQQLVAAAPEPAPAIGDIVAQRLQAMRAEAEAPIQPQAQPAPEAPTVPVQPIAPPQVGIAPEAPTAAPQAPVAPPEAVPVVTPTPTAGPEAQVAPITPEAPVAPAPIPTVDTPRLQEPQKKPLTYRIKQEIKIHPEGEFAAELRAAGITSRTNPGLFSRDGQRDLDNLPASEWSDLAQSIGVEGQYLSRQGLIDALIGEASGVPVQNAEQQRLQEEMDAEAALEEYQAAIDAETQVEPVAQDPILIQNPVIDSPEKDMRTPREREEDVSLAVDEMVGVAAIEDYVGPEVRQEVIQDLVDNGGDVETAIRTAINRRIEYVEEIGISEAPTPEGAALDAERQERAAREAIPEDTGRIGQVPARRGTEEGGAIDVTPEGRQMVIPGAEQITDKQRAERAQEAPMRGRAEPTPEGGLFDDDARKQIDIFDQPTEKTHPAVQNEDGTPKTLYHGTSETFEEFQAPTRKEGEHEFRADRDIGVFLTSDPEAASYYAAEGDRDTRNIRPVKVHMTNPFIYDYEGRKKDSALNIRLADKAKAAGHDGLILRNVKDTPQLTNVTEDVYVAFDPAQVSSVFDKKPVAPKKKALVLKEVAEVEEVKKKAPTTKKPQPKGTLAPTFLAFSFSNRNSVYEAAFRAAGIEPDKARLMTVDQQIAALRRVILSKFGVRVVMPKMLVTRKTITGRKAQVAKQQIGYRDAIDQMLDAYRQMTMLAHIFGVPESAIGLTDKNGTKITLSLVRRLRGALGSYSGGERTIALPGRSNSFAHEWGHAFDHWLSGFLMDLPVNEVENLLSRDVFNDGIQPGSTRSSEVAQAFVGLLQTLFGDSAKMAMMQIDLQQQATDTLKNGKPSPKAKRAMKALKDIESGKKLPKEVLNDYFKTSAEFDKMFGAKGYFTDPAEMLARAFETFAGVKASMVSDLPTSFLSKPDWAYTESEETRSRMTFPRGVDAERVFLSIERLGDELRDSEIFGTEGIAQKPEDVDVFDMRHWDKWKPKGSLLAQEREAWRKNKDTLEAVETDQTKMRKLRDWASYYASTVNGNLRGIVRRQPVKARKSLTNLLDMFMKDPGSGRDTGVSWERAVEAWAKRMTNRFENITTAFNLQRLNKKEMLELRRLLTVSGASSDNANLVKAAASLRRMLDETWRYLDSAGVKIGYVKNGWLPRIIDMDVALAKAGDFKKQAAKVYSIMFDRDVRQAELEYQISDVRRLTAQLTRATRTDEHGESFRVNLFSPDEITQIKAWRKALNAVTKAEKAAKEDPSKIDAVEEATEAFMEVHAEVLDIMDKVFSEESARAWHAKILMGGPMDFDTKGPDSGFTKKRKMPAETDELMIDFYSGDPLSLIQQYLHMAPRRAEYVRRDTSSDGKSGKIERLLANAESHGADGRDIREIRNSINMLTGRSSAPTHAASQWVGGWVYVAATVTLLKRAFFSSWAEPLAAGLRTGNPRDSLRAMTAFMGQMVRTGKARDRVELARIIGLVTSAQHESIMMNRFGGDINPNSKQGKILANFFKYTLLTGLTNMQRMSMMAVSANAIRRHLEAAIHKKSKWSIEELNEIGIGEEHHQSLLDWINSLEGDIPKADDMIGVDGGFYNEAAALWASATGELVQQIIQNPTRYNRPTAAMDSKFRMMYGITGFIYAFHSNVIAPTFKRHIEERGDTESLAKYVARSGVGSVRNLAIAAPSVAALYTGHLLVTMLREALFNADKWKELEEDDDEDALMNWLLGRTFARTGLIGAWDIPYNLYTGVKYSRDLAGAYAGPHTSWALSSIEDIVRLGSDRNAASTNTGEWNALDTVLELLMETGSSLAISSMPGGSIASPVYGGAMWAIDAYNPSDVLTDMLIGPKGTRHGKGDLPWWEVGD